MCCSSRVEAASWLMSTSSLPLPSHPDPWPTTLLPSPSALVASKSLSFLPPSESTPVLLPLASGGSDVGVLLVPGEETAERHGTAGPHRACQHVELRAARPNKGAGAADVDQKPLLQQVTGVIGQQWPLAHKLHTPFHFHFHLQLHLRLPRSDVVAPTAAEFSCDGCWRRGWRGVSRERRECKMQLTRRKKILISS